MASPVQAGRRKAAVKRPLASPANVAETNGPTTPVIDEGFVAAKKSKPNEASVRMKTKKEEITSPKGVINVKVENEDNQNGGKHAREVLAFDWTSEELTHLITNLSACLPRIDNVKYTTLIDKLDWEKVRFGIYTAAQCKEKWMQIVTRLRRFRTLTDMVTDAKEWLKHPWSSYSSSKKQKHPAMPKKPLTPYFRYFLEKREKYSKDHPDMSMTDLAKLLSKKFQQLPDKKKQRYKESYEKENEIYKQDLEKFKKCHPEQFPTPEMRQQAVVTEGPEKPHTAFAIYINEKLKKPEYVELDRREAMEKLRKQWNALVDYKRVKWIKKAVLDEQRYGIEIEKYCAEHPDFHPEPVKPVLNKTEKELKDRFDGKPERPPNSGYSLFSRIMLREMKEIPSKLKMAEISKRWKLLKDCDRDRYNVQAQKAIAKYKESYAAYLSKLPEKEREKIENEAKLPNKKKTVGHSTAVNDSKNDISELEAIEGGRSRKPLSAMFYFQQEKFALYRQKHPELSKQDTMKMLAKEYNDLPDKKKDKYRKIAEEAKKAYDEGSTNKRKESSGEGSGKRRLFKGEPKKPPQSGYGLFSTEMLSVLTDVDPKNRMGEIAKRWKAMTPADKDKYKKKVQELMKKYTKDIEKFITSLSPAEIQEFEKHKKATLKMKAKKRKATDQTTNVNNKEDTDSDSSDDDDTTSSSDDDDDDDDSDKSDDSGSGSGSGSGSFSGSDDSDSDSDSDDDDDDDDGDGEKKGRDENNDSSSDDSDGDSDSGSGSESGSGSDDSSDSGSESEEAKSE